MKIGLNQHGIIFIEDFPVGIARAWIRVLRGWSRISRANGRHGGNVLCSWLPRFGGVFFSPSGPPQ
ncbi:MAG: hypothetical protein IT495_13335 [Gammaproteobacteria bacterium]|nr:hypothetical protein [Gammaproteobacteria bacterium]